MPSPPYRLLGIDPGTNLLGYAILQVNGPTVHLGEMGVIHLHKLGKQSHKLRRIFERLQAIMDHHHPKEMAIEAPFYGKNAQSMLKLGRAQGVAMAAAITKDIEVTEYAPRKIKRSITGNGNASKEQVASMLAQILRQPLNTEYLDATDALAAAVCHYYQLQSPVSKASHYQDWNAYLKSNPHKKV